MTYIKKGTKKLLDNFERIARRERRRMVRSYGSPRGECYRWSMNLACSLTEAGYRECFAIYGYIKSDTESKIPHHWLICEGVVLDITADQFNGAINQKFPEVLISAVEALTSHVQERRRRIMN
jgi:hypothetical protein